MKKRLLKLRPSPMFRPRQSTGLSAPKPPEIVRVEIQVKVTTDDGVTKDYINEAIEKPVDLVVEARVGIVRVGVDATGCALNAPDGSHTITVSWWEPKR